MNNTPSKKDLSTPVLILAGLVILGAAGLVVALRVFDAERKPFVVQENSNDTQNTNEWPEPIISAGSVEGWQKYTNMDIGYSIEVPNTWYLGESADGRTMYASPSARQVDLRTGRTPDDPSYDEAGVFLNIHETGIFVANGESIEEALKEKGGRGALPSITSKYTTVNRYKAYYEHEILARGDPLMDGSPSPRARSVRTYSLIGPKDYLITIKLQVDEEEDDDMIQSFERAVGTFQIL